MAYDKNEILDYTAFNEFNPCREVKEGDLVPVGWTGTLAEMIPAAKFSLQDVTWGVMCKLGDDTTRTQPVVDFIFDTIVDAFPERETEILASKHADKIYRVVPTYTKAGGSAQDLLNKLIESTE